MRSQEIIVLLNVGALLLASSRASAYCIDHETDLNQPQLCTSTIKQFDTTNSWGDTVQVYVSTYQGGDTCCLGNIGAPIEDLYSKMETYGKGLTSNDVNYYVRVAAANWFDEGQAAIRFSPSIKNYSGSHCAFLTDPTTAGGVLLMSDPGCNNGSNTPWVCNAPGALACTGVYAEGSDCLANRAIITVLSSGCNNGYGPVEWTTEPNWIKQENGYGTHDFVGVLEHEMGHALTLDHPAACGQPGVFAVMNIGAKGATFCPSAESVARLPFYDDIEGLLQIYAYRYWYTYYSMAPDNGSQSWGAVQSLGEVGDRPDTPFANATSSSNTFISFPFATQPEYEQLTNAFQNSATASSASLSYHNLAVASSNGSDLFVLGLGGEGEVSEGTLYAYYYKTLSSAPISGTVLADYTGGRFQVAYDPESGLFLYSYLSLDTDGIFLGTFVLGTSSITTQGEAAISGAYDNLSAVSMACSPSISQLSGNCIAVWTDSKSGGPTLHTSHFYVDGTGTPTFTGNDLASGYFDELPPTVAVGSDSSYPFEIGFTSSYGSYDDILWAEQDGTAADQPVNLGGRSWTSNHVTQVAVGHNSQWGLIQYFMEE